MPNPGVRSSMMMPSMPIVMRSELTNGWVRKRTTFSAQLGEARLSCAVLSVLFAHVAPF